MRAWAVDVPGPIDTAPLRMVERAVPSPGPHGLLVQVVTCGVCRTDLHLAEGDLVARSHLVTPGHEVVGVVAALGEGHLRGEVRGTTEAVDAESSALR